MGSYLDFSWRKHVQNSLQCRPELLQSNIQGEEKNLLLDDDLVLMLLELPPDELLECLQCQLDNSFLRQVTLRCLKHDFLGRSVAEHTHGYLTGVPSGTAT